MRCIQALCCRFALAVARSVAQSSSTTVVVEITEEHTTHTEFYAQHGRPSERTRHSSADGLGDGPKPEVQMIPNNTWIGQVVSLIK